MNEFERKLRGIPLRTPPPAWRDEILAAGAPRSWRESIWPPLPAWAALAAIWLVLLSINALTHSGTGFQPVSRGTGFQPTVPHSLLSFHAGLHSDRVLDLLP